MSIGIIDSISQFPAQYPSAEVIHITSYVRLVYMNGVKRFNINEAIFSLLISQNETFGEN